MAAAGGESTGQRVGAASEGSTAGWGRRTDQVEEVLLQPGRWHVRLRACTHGSGPVSTLLLCLSPCRSERELQHRKGRQTFLPKSSVFLP